MGRNKNRKSDVPTKTKLKKDPGVPRLPDLRAKGAEKLKAKELRMQPKPGPDATMAVEPTISTLALAASALATSIQDSATPDDPSSSQKPIEQTRRHYVRQLHQVIEESDIILLLLDARDPEGCRSRLVEEEVRRREHEGKRLVFVLNKIDLIPRENAQAWLRHLRHSTPTLPFRAPTGSSRTNQNSPTAPALMRLIKAYRPSSALSVTVGVVGFPNVGKSSLINALKRAKVCATSSTAGHTTSLQHIQLERGLRIVDSPGVVFDEAPTGEPSAQENSILLRNVLRPQDIPDPLAVVRAILARAGPDALQRIYGLPEFATADELVAMLALKGGRLGKGGVPDVDAAARGVLEDWNAHKIPFFSVPPAVHPSSVPSTVHTGGGASAVAPGAEHVGEARIVDAGLGAAFKLDGLFEGADRGAFEDAPMDTDVNADDAEMDADLDADEGLPVMDGVEDGVPMESDDLAHIVPRKRSRSPAPTVTAADPPPFRERMPKRLRRNPARDDALGIGRAVGAAQRAKKERKTVGKKDRRRERRAAALEAGIGGMEVDEGLEGTFMMTA